MLRWLLAICLLSAAYARVLLRPRELELGWPFDFDRTPISGSISPNATVPFTASSALASALATYNRVFPDLQDQCMLWNSSCSGNKTEVLDNFFDNNGTMNELVYGAGEYYPIHREKSGIPPDLNSQIVSWMREPDCRSSFLEWHTEHPDQSSWSYTDWVDNTNVSKTMDWSSVATTSGTFGCCDTCELVGGNVDVYYWPVPGANTDCLASVGTTAASDIDQNLIITDARGIGGGWWNPQPNPYLTSPSSSSNPVVPIPPQSLNARGHALLSAPGNGSESGTVAFQNGFTFTSPSIYVGFSSMYAVDRCGAIGTFIPYTMLAFAPGELSTIELPAWDRGSIPLEATKSFNFADLPCPPSSVMIADQYKPAPGSPYRPVLSPPHQIYSLQPGWSNCVVTHAFAGIDPPRSLKPAAALVPNLTPTLPQSQPEETTSTSALKPVSGAAEAGVTGATRHPSPVPAHKLQPAGPRSTPGPPSPFPAKNDPHTPETSLDPQDTQAVKTHSQLNGWQAPISSEAALEIQASSERAKDPSAQDPSKDGKFVSAANTEIPPKKLDAFHSSRASSDQRPDIKSALSPNTVISDSLPTHSGFEEKYEDGASIPLAATTRSPSSDDDRGQNLISPDQITLPRHGTSPQESEYPQGTTTAEPGSPQDDNRLNGDISTENRDPANQTKGNSDGSSTRIVADPPADPTSEANTARNPGVGSPVMPTSSPNDPFANDAVKNTALPDYLSDAKNPIIDSDGIGVSVALNAFTDAGHYVATTGFVESFQAASNLVSLPSLSVPSSSPPTMPADANTPNDPQSQSSNTTEAVPGQQATPALGPFQTPSKADSPVSLPSLSVPRSDLHSVLADTDTSSDPQSDPSNSIKAVLGNQTAPASEPSGTLTGGTRAQASSVSKSVLGGTTVLPYKNGVTRNNRVCLVDSVVCLASLSLLFLV